MDGHKRAVFGGASGVAAVIHTPVLRSLGVCAFFALLAWALLGPTSAAAESTEPAQPTPAQTAANAAACGTTETSAQLGVSVVIERPAGVGATVELTSDDPGVDFSADAICLGPVNPCTGSTAEASFQIRLSGVGLFTETISWTDLTGAPGTPAEGHTLSSTRLRTYRKTGPPEPIWTEIPNSWTTQLRLNGEIKQHFKMVFKPEWQDYPGQYAGTLDVSFEQR